MTKMVENPEVAQFFCDCLNEKGLKIDKIVLRKNIFRRAKLTRDAEIRTIRKFMVPLDIITMTPEEYENRTSLIAEYAHEGKVMAGTWIGVGPNRKGCFEC